MTALAAFAIRPAAVPAFLSLQHALRNLADNGRRTPCEAEPDPFISDNDDDRAEAAEACRSGCPVLELCADYREAQQEKWGVLGGVEIETARSKEARRRRAAA